jgi:uncharacterized protein YwgA
MDRSTLVLAALAPARGRFHTPVQLQKLLFLIDKNVAEAVEGPHFNFEPYDYGPFDKEVYATVDELARQGLVQAVETGRSWRKFALTANGQESGDDALASLDGQVRAYIEKLSEFVLSLSFPQLVSAIYKAYPDMRANSVFKE